MKANGFTSCVKLKLVREDLLNIMFNEVLPLGTKTFLSYQLRILREESPLVMKARERTNYELQGKSESSNAPWKVGWLSFRFDKFRTCTVGTLTLQALAQKFSFRFLINSSQNVVRALQNPEVRLREQVQKEKEELKGTDFNIEPMNVNIQEQVPIGTGKNVCENCHHRGHRN